MTDFLDEKRREITDRLKELGPMVEEYNRLEAAASALDGIGGGRRRNRCRGHSSPPWTRTPAWLRAKPPQRQPKDGVVLRDGPKKWAGPPKPKK